MNQQLNQETGLLSFDPMPSDPSGAANEWRILVPPKKNTKRAALGKQLHLIHYCKDELCCWKDELIKLN